MIHDEVRAEDLKLYARFVTSQFFSKLHLVLKVKNFQEKYEYSTTCFKIRYLRMHLGEVPELTSQLCEGPLAQMGTLSFSNRRTQPLRTVIISVNGTGPLTDGQHTLQLADSLIKDTGF